MTSAGLNKLPFEALQQIASYLHDTHRPSLYTFGLASKACHRATLPSVFREVHLTVHGRKALQCNVDALVKVLCGAESAHYVRHLGIKGFLLLNIDESDEPGNKARTTNTDDIDWFQRTGVGEVLGDKEPCLYGPFFPDEAIEVSLEEDVAWAPFPPSLLDALHKHHPQCKLYHFTFRLRSLRSETPDPHEMAIATSPCLYSVKTRYAWRDSNGEDDFHGEAVPELVAGLAPNLKEVRMVELIPSASQNWRRRLRIAREPWRGFPGFVPSRRIGLLTSLSLAGRSVNFNPDFLQTWNQRTDFSSLNRLDLGGGFNLYHGGISGEAMEWIVQNCSLPRLKTLRIRLDRDDEKDVRPNYANDAITFFTTLVPLYELSVDGPLEPEILDALLSRHGRALKMLSLCPSESRYSEDRRHIPMIFEKEHVLQIQDQCPALQDLAIPVKRTKSDAREAEIYRSFGKMERLQVLFLTLDCSNWQVTRGSTSTNDLSFDENDREFYHDERENLRKGYVREAFLNCAVDEMLARSIWETICRDKAGKRLESLKLYTTGGGNFGDATGICSISDVVDNLSRSWLIEKSVRDDEDIINLRELGQGAREARDKMLTAFYDKHYKGDRTGSALPHHSAVHIFRRIWASKKGSQDWRQDWASLSLHS
ncbi:hypothetical protein B0O99DRAFT_709868 [Bisporella sp. PMI_857]|nr:hypothetical protein B0O99DRAFT_709868 [Bisporella sp. PMI_857]